MLALIQQSAALVRRFTARARRLYSHKRGACAVLSGIIPKNALYFPGRERFMFFGAGMYCRNPHPHFTAGKISSIFRRRSNIRISLRTDAVILTQPP